MRDDTTHTKKRRKPYKRGNKFRYEPDPHEEYYRECDKEEEDQVIFDIIESFVVFLNKLGIKSAEYVDGNHNATQLYHWQFVALKHFSVYFTKSE